MYKNGNFWRLIADVLGKIWTPGLFYSVKQLLNFVHGKFDGPTICSLGVISFVK